MYAEAVNETSGPTSECVALLNKIRSRGNLPALTPDKYANSEAFFNAIEQERIVELVLKVCVHSIFAAGEKSMTYGERQTVTV